MGETPKSERPTTPEEDEKRYGLTTEEQLALTVERSSYAIEQLGIDRLTGLKNRTAFEDELKRALKAIHAREQLHSRTGGEPLRQLSLLFIDLDNFKQVNDTRGHAEGDIVLKKVAEILRGSIREADVVARFGGDEFYIFLPRADKHKAEEIADKIQKNLAADSKLSEFGIAASIGVSSVDASDPVDAETLIKQADVAMYSAKEKKKPST